ncbi:hypothetical protein Rhe02_02490 [Rhizocola hellebori]|uniref:Uncharacterized protein n=1 Tax=Rhizocola hellebori TaxID=1392758 RepID=A0A8J3Q2G9_9ACTN|nr:sialidase family protein [Rhizocola hellebori]GIH02182.1 hypothetical protein Rhe02_02490 [Rhizocola hellebori]
MTNLHELFEEATTVAPPSRLSVEDVFAAIQSRQRRRRVQTVLVAVAVVAVTATAGIALKSNFAAPPPADGDRPVSVVWAGRGDSTHLYLVRNTCDRSPIAAAELSPNVRNPGCSELLASSDGGATWLSRGDVAYPPRVLGPRSLLQFVGGAASPAGTSDPWQAFELSTDGGSTWRRLPSEGTPIDTMPPGMKVIDGFSGELMAFDPEQGRLRRLANQPPLLRSTGFPVTAGPADIWVSGLNPSTGRLAVAVSHDAGATWTKRDMPGGRVIPQPTLPSDTLSDSVGMPVQLIAGEGDTAYASVWDASAKPAAAARLAGVESWLKTYRTTDGGDSWQAVADGSTTPSYAWGWRAANGRIVVALIRGDIGTYATSADGVTYAFTAPPGLPASALVFTDGSIAFGYHAVYFSDDGWTWREVWRD